MVGCPRCFAGDSGRSFASESNVFLYIQKDSVETKVFNHILLIEEAKVCKTMVSGFFISKKKVKLKNVTARLVVVNREGLQDFRQAPG